MRTSSAIKNSITALVGNVITYIIAFIAQAIFIRILGAEYLGMNGLFTNILTMLSIFELGIGNAIVYNLYKPIADNDVAKIQALMNFYKKAYRIIAFTIFIVGILLVPFIKFMVGEITINVNIYIVYILFLLSTVSSYLMTYKRNLIIANQQNYIINLIHMGYLIILNVVQLMILSATKNYYAYLIVKIFCQLFENLVISIVANKKYLYLKDNSTIKLDKDTEKDIFSRVKALLFHKIGGIVVNGTDNIIISNFFGIETVGLYTNYYTITSAITSLFSQIITATTSSVGNLLVSNDKSKKYEIFDKIRFLNSWISVFTATCLFVLMQTFITIWVGEQYRLDFFVLIVIVFNYFQKMQRITYSTFKDSAGIWREDKFVPIIESLLNIVFSVILLKIFGLAGVFMGTIISGLILWCYSYPKFVYKKIFERSYKKYAIETLKYIILFIVISCITLIVTQLVNIPNIIIKFIIDLLICCILPNGIMILIFRNTEDYKYFKELIVKLLNKIINKEEKKNEKISNLND